MRKTFKYRLLGNKEVLNKTANWLDLCRNLYNAALQERIYAHKNGINVVLKSQQCHELLEVKKAFPEYKQVGAQTLQEVIGKLDDAFLRFFKRVKKGSGGGYPRFKSKNRYNSFTLTQCNWRLDGKYLYITNIGRFKIRLSRPIEGDIKTITIRKDNINHWYVYFSCDNVPEKKIESSGEEIGIDVGIKSFLVDSKGCKVDNPRYHKKTEKVLRIRNRKLHRKEKGSNHRKKERIVLAKTHQKIHNQRNDFEHKLANQYIKNYDTIFIENLKINNLEKNNHLSKAIKDSSWGEFFKMLDYKAEEAGRKVIKVSPYNTTQICSRCGEKVYKTLADRIHRCPYCGLEMDRDENSAVNVLQAGQVCRELTYGNSQSVSRESLKEECQATISMPYINKEGV
jgi:putative transposase